MSNNITRYLIIGLVVGILAGFLGSFAINQSQLSNLKSDITAKSTEIADLDSALIAKSTELTELGWITGPPPKSLDALYPPQAPGPIYLGSMFEISGAFQGIGIGLQEQDFQNAMANYELFREKFVEVSELVPEWEGQFDISKVDALGDALGSGDQDRIMGAMQEVGADCGSCHQKYMTAVQFKYHWPSFEDVSLLDPVASQDVSFIDYMWGFEASLGGFGADLGKGQVDSAIEHLDDFKSRFIGLRESCSTDGCHADIEKRRGIKQGELYFVSIDDEELLDDIDDALNSTPPNIEGAFELMQVVGSESCLKCHWVHLPSAQAKERWEHMEE
jgi:hypothetical protein